GHSALGDFSFLPSFRHDAPPLRGFSPQVGHDGAHAHLRLARRAGCYFRGGSCLRVFAIGDLHLPSAREKDMDRFGWVGHPGPLARAWDEMIGPDDLVLLLGDISWATRPAEATGDLEWIEARPGKKVLLKGNHDYWWPGSRKKLEELLAPYPSIVRFLHNGSAYRHGPYVLAGVRGWTVPEAPHLEGVDEEIRLEDPRPVLVERDAQRLERRVLAAEALADPASIRIASMHVPPVYAGPKETRFTPTIEKFRPHVCVYGHLRGPGIDAGYPGELRGICYRRVSCDAAGFRPVLVHESP